MTNDRLTLECFTFSTWFSVLCFQLRLLFMSCMFFCCCQWHHSKWSSLRWKVSFTRARAKSGVGKTLTFLILKRVPEIWCLLLDPWTELTGTWTVGSLSNPRKSVSSFLTVSPTLCYPLCSLSFPVVVLSLWGCPHQHGSCKKSGWGWTRATKYIIIQLLFATH